MKLLTTLMLGLAPLCLAATAGAQPYPSKPVRMIVSFAAGGGVDGMARVVAQQLERQMGQTFVVENRPGASGSIGADAVAKSNVPEIKAKLVAGGMDVVALPGARMAEVIRSEAAYNVATIKKLGFKPD